MNEAGLLHALRLVWPEVVAPHVLLAARCHLADFSAPQFARPRLGVPVEPWVVERPDREPPWVWRADAGALLRVDPRPDVTDYKTAPDWRRNHRPLAAELIRRLNMP